MSFYTQLLSHVIETVKSEEFHLISKFDFILKFQELNHDSQVMCIRLFSRNHHWIRADSLNPEKYRNALTSIEELESAGFILSSPSQKDLVDLLKKPELVSIAQKVLQMNDANRLSKYDLQSSLYNKLGSLEKVKETVGKVMKQSSEARLEFQKLFVIYQRLEEWPDDESSFMLQSILTNLDDDDSRKRTFPTLNYHRIGLIWGTCQEFEDYFNAIQLEAECRMIASQNDTECWLELMKRHKELEPKWKKILKHFDGHFTGIPWFSTFTAGWVLTRLFSNIFYQAYFRSKRYDDAIHLLASLLEQRLFLSTKRGFWFDESARLTENYASKQDALLICKQGLSDTMVVTHHRSSLYKRLASLSKALKRAPIQLRDRPFSPSKYPTCTLQAPHIRSDSRNHVLFESKTDGSRVRVEIFILEHFQLLGWKGYHAENSIITTLYGLLFWDILFDDSVPGVFAHPYQDRPLDLYTEFFFESRRSSIFLRLDEIRNGSASLLICNVYNRERMKNTRCIGVHWDRFSLADILEIVDCISAVALGSICELFSRQYWSHRGGMPDLCLWNPDKKKFKLVEVKSENDRLSERQVVWLQFLASANIDVEVVHVKDSIKKLRI